MIGKNDGASVHSLSVRDKRSEVQSQKRSDAVENRSAYGGSRHYQRGGNSRISGSMRTTTSMMTDATICGQSEFCRNLARVAEYDNKKANLMWNNYLNNHMLDMKKKKNKKEKKKNQKFAKDVRERMAQADERDRRKDRQKKETYARGAMNQRDDHLLKKQKEADAKRDEDAKLKSDTAKDNNRYYNMLQEKEESKLQNYRNGLNQQLAQKQQKDEDQRALDREISARNRNYLIDDSWKARHAQQLKAHLGAGLMDQIKDREEEQDYQRQKQIADDEQYRYDLQRTNDDDLRKRKQIEAAKKNIYLEEARKQEQEKAAQNQIERNLKNAEDEKVRAKILEDHIRYLDAERKKKAIMDDHLRKVSKQKAELEQKKIREEIERKKPYGTGLNTKGDNVKYFDYKDAMKMYPLRRKKKRIN